MYQLHSISSVFRTVFAALAGFAGPEQSIEVVKACEEFLCTLLCPEWLYITHVKKVWWYFSNYLDMNKDSTNSHVPMVHGWNIQGEHIGRRMFDHGM